jgi:GNAT superfamily N-acetyltransferase
MNDRIVEERRARLLLSTDRRRLDIDTVLAMLLASHWGGGMTRPLLERALENSVCVGVYELTDGPSDRTEARSDERPGTHHTVVRQVAFARAVSDLATYAYWTDVIVADDSRGRGIGSWMIESLLTHPDLQGLRRIALWSRDAAALYARYGFSTDMPASTYMELRART